MKILLTGSTGFLGKIIRSKLEIDNEVHTISRTNASYIVDLAEEQPRISELYDLVIHAAGLAHIKSNSDFIKNRFGKVNVTGTLNLLNSLQNYKPKMFLFISSVAVYGLREGINLNEDHPLLAKDDYGISKIEAENLVQEWCAKENVICTIFRLPLVVGPDPVGNLDSMIKAISNGYYFNISNNFAKKSIVLGDDVANCILKACYIGGIYNLTDGYNPSVNELSNCICDSIYKCKIYTFPFLFAKSLALIGDILGNRFPINSEKLTKLTSTLTFNDDKARTKFGWNPKSVIKSFEISNLK